MHPHIPHTLTHAIVNNVEIIPIYESYILEKHLNHSGLTRYITSLLCVSGSDFDGNVGHEVQNCHNGSHNSKIVHNVNLEIGNKIYKLEYTNGFNQYKNCSFYMHVHQINVSMVSILNFHSTTMSTFLVLTN